MWWEIKLLKITSLCCSFWVVIFQDEDSIVTDDMELKFIQRWHDILVKKQGMMTSFQVKYQWGAGRVECLCL